jgi:hypothetical protein
MGIDISLQDERGTVIEIIYDEKNILNTLLPREISLSWLVSTHTEIQSSTACSLINFSKNGRS